MDGLGEWWGDIVGLFFCSFVLHRFSATGRIVALVQAIRRAFDQLLEDKILRPDVDISSSPVLDVTCQLLETDGLG